MSSFFILIIFRLLQRQNLITEIVFSQKNYLLSISGLFSGILFVESCFLLEIFYFPSVWALHSFLWFFQDFEFFLSHFILRDWNLNVLFINFYSVLIYDVINGSRLILRIHYACYLFYFLKWVKKTHKKDWTRAINVWCTIYLYDFFALFIIILSLLLIFWYTTHFENI